LVDILVFKRRVLVKEFFPIAKGSQHTEDATNGHPQTSNAWLAAQNFWVGGDAIEKHSWILQANAEVGKAGITPSALSS
jgi:vacuolar-type H+-ATPase subunit D/Vma8